MAFVAAIVAAVAAMNCPSFFVFAFLVPYYYLVPWLILAASSTMITLVVTPSKNCDCSHD